MKQLLLSFVFFGAFLYCQAQSVLKEETPIKVKIDQELSSKDAQVGDIVHFTVVENVKVADKIVIESNTPCLGEVVQAEKSRSLGRPGKLDFTINTVKAVDGQNIKLRVTSKKMTGKNRTGGVVAAAVLVAPVALFIKGKNVTVEKGKEYLVYVDNDYTIGK